MLPKSITPTPTETPPVVTTPATPETPVVAAPVTPPAAAPADKLAPGRVFLKRFGYLTGKGGLPDDLIIPEEPTAPVEAPAPVVVDPVAPVVTPPEVPPVTPTPVKKAKRVAPAQQSLTAKEVAEIAAKAAIEANKPVVSAAPVENLSPAQKKQIELAEYAAQALPEYKELPAQLRTFYKKAEDFAVDYERKNGAGSFDDKAPEYQEFLAHNTPRFDRGAIEAQRIEDKSFQRSAKIMDERELKWDRRINEIKLGPVIQNQVGAAVGELISSFDPAVTEAYTKEPATVGDKLPIESPIVDREMTRLNTEATEFLRLSNNLTDYDKLNPLHIEVGSFLSAQDRTLEGMTEEQRTMPDGKVMIGRMEFNRMAQQNSPELQRVTTYTDDAVIKMMMMRAQKAAKDSIDGEYARIKKAGWTKTPAVVAPVVAPAKSAASPAAPVTASTPAPKGGASLAPGTPPVNPSSVDATLLRRAGYKESLAR